MPEEDAEPSNPPRKQPKNPAAQSQNQRSESAGGKPSGGRTGKLYQTHFTASSINKTDHTIVINRAPVLQSWGAVVTTSFHSNPEWGACLSIGDVVSALCATSKGCAIGLIEPPDDRAQKARKQEPADKFRSFLIMASI